MRQQRHWAGVLALLAAALLGSAPTAAQESEPVLPPPTLSSTDLHVGDVIDVSGTGCVRPDTGSGEGLTAAVYREWSNRGANRTNVVDLPVAADGSYSGQWPIDQVLPNGPLDAVISCESGTFQGASYAEISSARVAVTATSPQLPDLTVEPGATAPFAYPCGEDGYGVDVDLGDGVELSPDPFLGVVGQTTHLAIPGDLAVGPHDAIVSCHSDGGTFALFNLRLILTAPGVPTPPPAVPQPADAAYTG